MAFGKAFFTIRKEFAWLGEYNCKSGQANGENRIKITGRAFIYFTFTQYVLSVLYVQYIFFFTTEKGRRRCYAESIVNCAECSAHVTSGHTWKMTFGIVLIFVTLLVSVLLFAIKQVHYLLFNRLSTFIRKLTMAISTLEIKEKETSTEIESRWQSCSWIFPPVLQCGRWRRTSPVVRGASDSIKVPGVSHRCLHGRQSSCRRATKECKAKIQCQNCQ